MHGELKALGHGAALGDRGQPEPVLSRMKMWLVRLQESDETAHHLVLPLALLLVFAGLGIWARPVLGEGNSSLIFVLGITLIGAVSGVSIALACALLGAIIFDVFVTAPIMSFNLRDSAGFAPAIVFSLCAIVSAMLSGRLRDESRRVRQNNLLLESLLDTSRSLQPAVNEVDVFNVLANSAAGRFDVSLGLYQLVDGRAVAIGGSPDTAAWSSFAAALCQSGEEMMVRDGLSAYMLSSGREVVGALVCRTNSDGKVNEKFMVALAQVAALALERTQLARRLTEAQALARADELKSVLLSSVSHDLRSPLTVINTSASTLLQFGDSFDVETSRELLAGIVDESDRLNHLTSNLLEMTRLQAGGGHLRMSVLPTSEMIRGVIARKMRNVGNRKITFVARSGEIQIVADAALFDLVLTNVLQNAIRYSPADRPIRVTCETDGAACLICVTDEGIGISPEDQLRVFDRFYRGERGDKMSGGSGLGLAIAKGFVEASGGSISITSPVSNGQGTAISIRLPIAPAHDLAED